MGGKALKNAFTRRFPAVEFRPLADEVVARIERRLPGTKPVAIPWLRDKADFGDLDVLLDSGALPGDWIETVKDEFRPTEIVNGGFVRSLDVRELQVDLILAPTEARKHTLAYLSHSDLGNLMGRVAKRLGFVLAMEGLRYVVRDSDHTFREILVTSEPTESFAFLGYDLERADLGFDDREALFEYLVSSPYATSDVFLGRRKSHEARRKVERRPTHAAFLAWLETRHPSETEPEDDDEERRENERKAQLERAFVKFPSLRETLDRALDELDVTRRFRKRFDARAVAERTGLAGKELGGFLSRLRALHAESPDEQAKIIANLSEEAFLAAVDRLAAEEGLPKSTA
jgi:hypothetical protein